MHHRSEVLTQPSFNYELVKLVVYEGLSDENVIRRFNTETSEFIKHCWSSAWLRFYRNVFNGSGRQCVDSDVDINHVLETELNKSRTELIILFWDFW